MRFPHKQAIAWFGVLAVLAWAPTALLLRVVTSQDSAETAIRGAPSTSRIVVHNAFEPHPAAAPTDDSQSATDEEVSPVIDLELTTVTSPQFPQIDHPALPQSYARFVAVSREVGVLLNHAPPTGPPNLDRPEPRGPPHV